MQPLLEKCFAVTRSAMASNGVDRLRQPYLLSAKSETAVTDNLYRQLQQISL